MQIQVGYRKDNDTVVFEYGGVCVFVMTADMLEKAADHVKKVKEGVVEKVDIELVKN